MAKYRKVHFSNFKKKDDGSGVMRLDLTSWDEFHNVVKTFADNKSDYLWRGQRCDWDLKSSFDRKFGTFVKRQGRQDKLKEIFESFKRQLGNLPVTKIDSLTDDEIWAIGQHYGLPTPLLDWTECPYVAAYMAFWKECLNMKQSTNTQPKKRIIYALSRALGRLKAKTKDPLSNEVLATEQFVEFPDIPEKNDLDPTQNARLRAQKGKFTRALNGVAIKKNVKRLSEKGRYNQEIILAEILLPDTCRAECLDYLRAEKKLTHGTLFPDYAGAVEICKIELDLG